VSASARREISVFVVAPPRLLLLDVAGPLEALRRANLEQNSLCFTVAYVGPAPCVKSSIGLELAGVAPLPASLPEGAWVVLPGSADCPLGAPSPPQDDSAQMAEIVDWLATAVRSGVKLVSICSGALLAARAGLLDDRACTTHHALIDELRAAAPRARVLHDRLFVDDGERLSSAGITTGVDLMLHLIAREAGPAVASAVARFLVVYTRRAGADPQLSPWLEGRNHLHPAVHRAEDAIAADPAKPWPLAAVARAAGASPRNLSRLFNEHAGMSVTDYVNRLRVSLARQMIVGARLDMEAIAERSGFGSARQLRRVWARVYPEGPRALRSGEQPVDAALGSRHG